MSNRLKLRRLGINTYLENIIYMRSDCEICKSEGFRALTRVVVSFGDKSIVATMNVIESDLLTIEEASLSQIAFERLGVIPGDEIMISHLEPIDSLKNVRAKIYGNTLSEEAYFRIIRDITQGKYSDIQLSAYVTGCSGRGRMTTEEIIYLTKAMMAVGESINWKRSPVVDKHSIGGLPGNRTTPIVVSIVAAAGLCIPKTSSRAITSPAGTADVMEVMTKVDISEAELRQVVEREGGCLVWGGAVKLSPADDILIRVERALDIDSPAQLIASVLSKKAAAGSTHVLIDIPVGPTAKVRSQAEAEALRDNFQAVAQAIGLKVKVFLSDGTKPVGRGIGPVLEAEDVLAVLRNDPHAPRDLADKSVQLAALVMEFAGLYEIEAAEVRARHILESGEAQKKFMAICEAQGGFRNPVLAPYSCEVSASISGTVSEINNRMLAKTAKLAGAPMDSAAGIYLQVLPGDEVKSGDTLFRIYAGNKGLLDYVSKFVKNHPEIIQIT